MIDAADTCGPYTQMPWAIHASSTRTGDDLDRQIAQVLADRRWDLSETWQPVEWGESPTAARGALGRPVLDLQAPPVSSPVLAAVKRLRAMRAYGQNWNAEGAPAPNPEAVDAAVVMVGFLAPLGLRMTVMLDAFGQPLVLVSNGEGEGEVVLTGPDTFDFAWFGGGAAEDGDAGLHFDGQQLPSRLAGAFAARGLAAA